MQLKIPYTVSLFDKQQFFKHWKILTKAHDWHSWHEKQSKGITSWWMLSIFKRRTPKHPICNWEEWPFVWTNLILIAIIYPMRLVWPSFEVKKKEQETQNQKGFFTEHLNSIQATGTLQILSYEAWAMLFMCTNLLIKLRK